MPWIDRMSRARFRDFEFLTENHDAKSGRRLVVHEYPDSDVPLVEDLGGKAWNWSLDAYFLGPDYDLARNRFLALLAEPGPGWLTHSWLGELWVRAQDWSVAESNKDGGYCTVKVQFVEGGEIRQPARDLGDVAQAACNEAAQAAVDAYEQAPMQADALQAFVAAVHQRLEGLRRIVSLATLPLAWANTAISTIEGVKTDLAAIAAIPNAYANALLGIAHALGLRGADGNDAGDGLDATRRTAVVGRIASAAAPAKGKADLSGANVADGKLADNLWAEFVLEQRLIAAAALSVAVADYPGEFERDAALAVVEQVSGYVLPAAPDAVFQPAATARAAVITALLAQDLKPGIEKNVVAPLPAVLLAYRLEVDEELFIARNAVRHPLFVNGEVHG